MLNFRSLTLIFALSMCTIGCADSLPGDGHHAAPLLASDGGPGADMPASSVCTSACQAAGAHLCVKDSNKARCVECTSDAHCTANPAAFGDTCDTSLGICLCKGSAGCTGKAPGARCLSTPFTPLCGCQTDADCTAPLRCVGQAFGGKVCQAVCKADTDCKAPATPLCQAKTGACVACKADTDCNSPYAPTCSATLGRCVACAKDGDCTEAGRPRCDLTRGSCEACTADNQCPGVSGLGSKCLLSTTGRKRCQCSSDAECVGNQFGPTCDTASSRCSCTKDTQCKAPLSRCAPPFHGAGRKQCAGACTDNASCGLGLRCLVTSGKVCGECNKDSHCATGVRNKCDEKAFRCVACKADTDCKGDTPRCDMTSGACVACATNADCAASAEGPVCEAGVCGCAADKECTGLGLWGSKCVSFGGLNHCGCATNAQCGGNANGPICFVQAGKCSCAADTDCKAADTDCRVPYPGAQYKACMNKCKTDKECTASETPYCDLGTGLCLPCLKDAHCASNPWEHRCDTKWARCVECVADADCTAKTLGKVCKGSVCLCKTDAQCKGNEHGAVCDTLYQSCSCTKDTDCTGGKTCKASKMGQKIKLCQ